MAEIQNENLTAEEPEMKTVGESESLADRTRIISPAKLVLKRFFRSKLSVIGLVTFVVLLLFSFLGPLFVPWEEKEQEMYTEPHYEYRITEAKAVDENGEEYTFYIVSQTEIWMNEHAGVWTYGTTKSGVRALHVLGTDKNGYDVFVRLMYGGRLSLTLCFMVVLIYTLIGVVLGGLAGYFGGWVDNVIMRIVDILNCLPTLPLLLIIGALLEGWHVPQQYCIYYLMLVVTLLSWTGTARLVRGQILFLREQEYMVAADALGLSPARKLFRHLVPNVMPQLIVSMTLGLGSTILYEASLSFLGLGVPPDMASLGQMVNVAIKSADYMTYYVADWLPAGIMIILAVVAFNFIGDGLRDALDPKMKR